MIIKQFDTNKLQKISLWAFIFFSFITPDVYSWIRFIFFTLFFLIGVVKFQNSKTHSFYWIFISFILLINLLQLFRGYLIYGDVSLIEARVIVIYYFIFVILTLFINESFINTIESAVIFGSIFIGLYFCYFFLAYLNVIPLYFGDFLKQNYDISDHYDRYKVYAVHLNILAYTIPFCIFKVLLEKKKRTFVIFVLIISGIAALISLRRGIILSAALGTIFSMFIITKYITKLLLNGLIIIGGVLLMLSIYFYTLNLDSQKYTDEILSSIDFSENTGNVIRKEQYNFLTDKISEKPLFGYGLGANDPGHVRDNNNPAHFELGYIKMIYASGLIIFLLNLSFTFWGIVKSRELIYKSKEYTRIIAPALAGMISLLLYNITNPIFAMYSYMFCYFYLFYLINIYYKSNNMLIIKI